MARALGEFQGVRTGDAATSLFGKLLQSDQASWSQSAFEFACQVEVRRTSRGLEVVFPTPPLEEVQ